jgi:hypothetical protein
VLILLILSSVNIGSVITRPLCTPIGAEQLGHGHFLISLRHIAAHYGSVGKRIDLIQIKQLKSSGR